MLLTSMKMFSSRYVCYSSFVYMGTSLYAWTAKARERASINARAKTR